MDIKCMRQKVEAATTLFKKADMQQLQFQNTSLLRDGKVIPEPENVENYSGQIKLRMPKSLHKQLAEHAKREGIRMNQYCLYLLAMNDVYRMGKVNK